jgi:hypothetical protein
MQTTILLVMFERHSRQAEAHKALEVILSARYSIHCRQIQANGLIQNDLKIR